MLLWGVEGKQLHSNVGYLDLRERLRMLDSDQEPYGMKRVDWETGKSVSSVTGSAPAVSPATGEEAEATPKTPNPREK
jgi:hypothetical protein